jgi:hypothetical protein
MLDGSEKVEHTDSQRLPVQNQHLYEHLMELSKQSFAMLNQRELVQVLRECITITEGGGGSSGLEVVPSFWWSLQKNEGDVRALLEFTLCVDAVLQSHDVPEGTEIEKSLIDFLRKLAEASVLSNTPVSQWKPPSFDLDIYTKTYQSYEGDLYSGKQMIAFAHLRGFESEVQDIDLGNSFRIRRVLPDELVQLWYGHDGMQGFIDSNDFRVIQFCIVEEYAATREFSRQEFHTIVTALRLWKSGKVGYDTVYCFPKWSHLGGQISGGKSVFFGHPPVSLESSEIEEFKDFYARFRDLDIDSHDFLRIAITRFNDSYQRMQQEDELLDIMIGLEALFSEAPGDLSWKVSRRVARLLETEPDSREDLSDIVRGAYAARNDIAHGNQRVTHVKGKFQGTEREKIPLHDFVPLIRDYLRRSIREFIERIRKDEDKVAILAQVDFGP